MKIRILGLLAVTAALGAAASLAACDQPKIECTSARGGFAAKYYKVSGTGTCSELKGDIIGLQPYNPADSVANCEKRGDDTVCDGTKPDFSSSTLAIQTTAVGSVGPESPDPDATHKMYSLGSFTSTEPDGNDFCMVPTLSAAHQVVEEVAGEGGGSPAPLQTATDVTYEWSNAKLYVTTAAPGTQMTADLKVTQDGCTAQYKVVALYPGVSCASEDADGNPTIDPKLCEPEADPEKGYAFGSGINPDFPVECDPVLALCVLKETSAGQPPAIPVLSK